MGTRATAAAGRGRGAVAGRYRSDGSATGRDDSEDHKDR